MGKDSAGRIGPLISEIEKTIEADPLAAAKLCQSALREADKGYHEELYEILATVYELANVFRSNKPAWQSFCEEEIWQRCKQKKPTSNARHNEIILWVSRFVFRAVSTEGTRYNRAYKHARTLQRYARDKIPQSDVAEKLAKKGADYAFRMEVEEHPRRTQPEESSGGGANSNRHHRDAGASGKHKSQPTLRNDGSRVSNKSVTTSDHGTPILQVEVTEDSLDRVLGLRLGQKARITVEMLEDEGDWKRIVATRITVLDD